MNPIYFRYKSYASVKNVASFPYCIYGHFLTCNNNLRVLSPVKVSLNSTAVLGTATKYQLTSWLHSKRIQTIQWKSEDALES